MADALVHALAFDDTVRIVAAVSTETVGTALEVHDTSPTATAALGRLLTGAALMGATLKDGARVALQLQGRGPLGMLLARSSDSGDVYGTVTHPQVDLPTRADGKLDVCTFRGGGFFRGLYYFFCVVFRRHHSMSATQFSRFSELTIESGQKIPYELDGDPGGYLPLKIRVVPDRMAILVPEGWQEAGRGF